MITFYTKDASAVARISVNSGIVPSIAILNAKDVAYAKADGLELKRACLILNKTHIVSKSFVFVGDEARTIYLNWGDI